MHVQEDRLLSPLILPLGAQRFQFPEVVLVENEERADAARIMWPACERGRACQAAAEAAEGIRWRLPKTSSAILAFTSPLDEDAKDQPLLAVLPELAKRSRGECLVVDADPGPHALMQHLTLAGPATPKAGNLIYPSNLPRLHVMALTRSGQTVNPEWVHDWRERWPLVLINAPSLEHRRGGLITGICDGTYLVVRLNRTSRRAVREAAEVIRAQGGRLLGCLAVQ